MSAIQPDALNHPREEELRNLIARSEWDWDVWKIWSAILHKEATVEGVIEHIERFERENKGKPHSYRRNLREQRRFPPGDAP